MYMLFFFKCKKWLIFVSGSAFIAVILLFFFFDCFLCTCVKYGFYAVCTRMIYSVCIETCFLFLVHCMVNSFTRV